MSAEATGWVWKHSPLSGAQLLVHLAIADVVNDAHEHMFWMTTSKLAEKARVGRSATVTALRELVEAGFLAVVESGGGRGRGTQFRFLYPETARSATSMGETARSAPETARSDAQTARSAPHIGITQELKNPSGFSDGKCGEWVPLTAKNPTVARCALNAGHDGPCEPVVPALAGSERKDIT